MALSVTATDTNGRATTQEAGRKSGERYRIFGIPAHRIGSHFIAAPCQPATHLIAQARRAIWLVPARPAGGRMAAMFRPRLQFRLSTLLWITLAVACWFGGMRFERWLARPRGDHIQKFSFFMGRPPSDYGPQPGPSPTSGTPIPLDFVVPIPHHQPQATPPRQ